MLGIHNKSSLSMNIFIDMLACILNLCAGVWCNHVCPISISLRWTPFYVSASLQYSMDLSSRVAGIRLCCEVITHSFLIDLLSTAACRLHTCDISSSKLQ
jgi:hypothetical protein